MSSGLRLSGLSGLSPITLRRVNCRDTIHSIIADANKRELFISTGSSYVANRRPKHFDSNTLFGATQKIHGNFEAMLARNLDWPLAIFAPLARLFVREGNSDIHTVALLHSPGLMGGYAGMNDHGLCFGSTIVPGISQEGIPNQILFRQVLERAKSVREALKIIEKSQPATAMNLLLAAPDGIMHVECDPARKNLIVDEG